MTASDRLDWSRNRPRALGSALSGTATRSSSSSGDCRCSRPTTITDIRHHSLVPLAYVVLHWVTQPRSGTTLPAQVHPSSVGGIAPDSGGHPLESPAWRPRHRTASRPCPATRRFPESRGRSGQSPALVVSPMDRIPGIPGTSLEASSMRAW